MAVTYELGPDTATLMVKTKKSGAAAKAGHDLDIEVTSWSGTLELAGDLADSTIALTADPTSLKVREGRGGMMALGDTEKAAIEESMNDEVLKRTPSIAFRSTAIAATDTGLDVTGELELNGRTHPVSFALALSADGALSGAATVRQSDWGMKPYSALFGTLKVVDEVEVVVTSQNPDRRETQHG